MSLCLGHDAFKSKTSTNHHVEDLWFISSLIDRPKSQKINILCVSFTFCSLTVAPVLEKRAFSV